MRESVTYQAILREGRQEGRKQGLVNIVLRLLTHKFGTLPPNIHTKITRLKIARLENLAEAILDFEVFADLELWFIKKYSLPSIKIDIKTQELVLRRSAPQRLIFHWEGSSYVCKVWQQLSILSIVRFRLLSLFSALVGEIVFGETDNLNSLR